MSSPSLSEKEMMEKISKVFTVVNASVQQQQEFEKKNEELSTLVSKLETLVAKSHEDVKTQKLLFDAEKAELHSQYSNNLALLVDQNNKIKDTLLTQHQEEQKRLQLKEKQSAKEITKLKNELASISEEKTMGQKDTELMVQDLKNQLEQEQAKTQSHMEQGTALADALKKTKEALKTKEDLVTKLQNDIKESSDNLDRVDKEKAAESKKITSMQKELDEAKEMFDNEHEQTKTLLEQIQSLRTQHMAESKAHEDKIVELETAAEKSKEITTGLKKQITQLEQDIRSKEQELENNHSEAVKNYESSVKTLEATNADMKELMEKQLKELVAVRKENKELENRVEGLQNDVENANKDVKEAQKSVAESNKEVENVKEQLAKQSQSSDESANKEMERLKETISQMQRDNKDLGEHRDELNRELKAIKVELRGVESAQTLAFEDKQKALDQVKDLQGKLTDFELVKSELEALKDKMQSSENNETKDKMASEWEELLSSNKLETPAQVQALINALNDKVAETKKQLKEASKDSSSSSSSSASASDEDIETLKQEVERLSGLHKKAVEENKALKKGKGDTKTSSEPSTTTTGVAMSMVAIYVIVALIIGFVSAKVI